MWKTVPGYPVVNCALGNILDATHSLEAPDGRYTLTTDSSSARYIHNWQTPTAAWATDAGSSLISSS